MFAPRKAIWCVRRRKSFYPIGTPTSRRGAGGERKAPCWHDKRQLCRRNSPLAGPDAPTPARGQGLQPYGALDCFRWRSEGVQGASGKPPACIDRRQLCRKKFPRWGMTRRLRRGLGLAVPWGAHTFLSVAKEKCAKESQRHGDSGKKAPIAHFDGGARNVARNGAG